jgi:hypothetical protein
MFASVKDFKLNDDVSVKEMVIQNETLKEGSEWG